MKKYLITLSVLFIVLNMSIFASGFQINENGARAMAMAGAFTGVATDASTVYYNPAGLTNLEGTQFLAGVTLISPSATFTGPAPMDKEWEMESQVFTPFNVYVTHRLNEQWGIGLGVNNQYGLGTKWDDNWAGRYLALDTEIKTFFFNPTVSFKPSDMISIGAGFTYAYSNVKIVRKTPIQDPATGAVLSESKVTLEGNGSGIGFTAGIMLTPSDQFHIGLSYRSEVTIDHDGDATSDPATFAGMPLPNGSISASLTTPQNITLGIGFMPTEKLTIAADFQYVGWSSYDTLAVTFNDYDLAPFTPGKQNVQAAPREYEDSFIIRAGAEYLISDKFALRGGILYDKNPVQDKYVEPTLPDADRIGLNIGFGYELADNFHIDVAYMYLMFSEREVTNSAFNFNGTYQNNAHLFGVNLGYAIK